MMHDVFRLKITAIFISTIFILGIFSGCKPHTTSSAPKASGSAPMISGSAGATSTAQSISATGSATAIVTEEPNDTAPPEIKPDDYIANNRTNLNNGGTIAEDGQYIFYKNMNDDNALYRIDKTTLEKRRLAESTYKKLSFINVTDDKIYYMGGDPDVASQENSLTLYSISKDGTGKTKIKSGIYGKCVISNGYAYYATVSNLPSDLLKYDLNSKNISTLAHSDSEIRMININDDGNRVYYQKRGNANGVYEYDLVTGTEKVLLSGNEQAGANNMNYYAGSLYYSGITTDGGLGIYQYDIEKDTIVLLSKCPVMEGAQIDSIAVSHLGLFFLAFSINSDRSLVRKFLYNGETLTPTLIAEIPASGSQASANIINGYIAATSSDYIKFFTLKGTETNLGL